MCVAVYMIGPHDRTTCTCTLVGASLCVFYTHMYMYMRVCAGNKYICAHFCVYA